MDELRSTEYDSFARIGLERAKTSDGNAYQRIENQKNLIKERIKQAGGDTNRALFHDLFH